MISGTSKVCGVMGNPVEHSMSPLMHNFYAERTGIDLVYVPLKVQEALVGDAVKGAFALNFTGVNVTVPHKLAVMDYLVEIDEDAMGIGAVNTLVRMEKGYKGYNTDAAGLLRAMKGQNISISGRPCILLGAGGAAKAAAYVLAKEGASVIYCLNRNEERAKQLSAYINKRFGKIIMKPMAVTDYHKLPGNRYLAVQTTSVGMHPRVGAAPIEDPAFYGLIEAAVDIVYNPLETRFMELVRAAGGMVMGGLDMLIYQGIIAYELWNPGVLFTEETVSEARKLMIKQLEEAQ